ncbi:hypothetical protein RJ641_035681 [Dillenia turbinata]|uniref:Uncharacterized protein n=1 Tax=Dillenia turbinata TaxID=194707 RepID=A0AAN8VT33_9MAGN
MAAKPLTSEAIALTEKKMDMTLDDIIKMSKNTGTNTKAKKSRVPNKIQRFPNNTAQERSAKMRRYMDSRSTVRQGFLAQRRSNFGANQFPLATEAARKAAATPICNRAFNQRMVNWNKPRIAAPARGINRGVARKPQQKEQLPSTISKQRPKTLDSLFANMKEQRMRGLSQQNNAGGHNRVQRRPPWTRN